MDDQTYFAGVEGGATCSKFALIKMDGEILTWSEGPGTNYFLNGFEETMQRIDDLFSVAKKEAGLHQNAKLKGLGLSLSGAEDDNLNKEFLDGMGSKYPNLSEHYYITSDSVGTIVTALEKGGVVLIAGTGSSCRLLNPGGDVHCCGGWGHMIGDQGSAYWIALQAIRTVFETEDGLNKSPYDITYVKNKMIDFYHLKNKIGILDHLHKKFEKPKFAKFCKELAIGATEYKDLLCFHLFREAGRILGRHVLAVAKFADRQILQQEGGLPIVTVGSVWNSFELLKEGFLEGLQPRGRGDVKIEEVKLFRLKASPAIGAAFLAGKAAGITLPIDFTTHAEVYFQSTL